MRPEDGFPPKTTPLTKQRGNLFFLFCPINYYRSPTAATGSLKRECFNKPLCASWQALLVMGMEAEGPQLGALWCVEPLSISPDTYTTAGEMCGRDIELPSMNPTDSKHGQLRPYLERS